MGDFAKLNVNDDLKIDWDDKKLVVFHFFRSDGESCTIRVWDIEATPKFVYAVEKGIECITDKVFVHDGHVVIVPSWPLQAGAVVMTLSIEDKMNEVGKFLFHQNEIQQARSEEHTSNSSHITISYAVFCLKKKKIQQQKKQNKKIL